MRGSAALEVEAPRWTAAAGGGRAAYETAIVRDEAGLRALRDEWTALYQRDDARNPFLSYEWAAGCWSHVCAGARLFVVTARHEGRLVGVAPLRLERRLGLRV